MKTNTNKNTPTKAILACVILTMLAFVATVSLHINLQFILYPLLAIVLLAFGERVILLFVMLPIMMVNKLSTGLSFFLRKTREVNRQKS